MITAYLDMTESLMAQAAGDAEFVKLIESRRGADPTVYLASWRNGSGRFDGFVSAASPDDAIALATAHERGFGREIEALAVKAWGSQSDLADWMRSRCSR